MKYDITFKKRGEITDDQKKGLQKKLKFTILKEKGAGSAAHWIIKAKNEITDEDFAKALRFYKISKEMSHAQIDAV